MNSTNSQVMPAMVPLVAGNAPVGRRTWGGIATMERRSGSHPVDAGIVRHVAFGKALMSINRRNCCM